MPVLLMVIAVCIAEPKAIAEQGFQFLLLDTYSQLWLLLQQYISNAQKKAGAHNKLLQTMRIRLPVRATLHLGLADESVYDRM